MAYIRVAGEAIMAVGDGLNTRPDMCTQEVHVRHIFGAILWHQRLQTATQRSTIPLEPKP